MFSARQQPFIVGVYTDDDATALTGSTGFNLAYTQLPCWTLLLYELYKDVNNYNN